MYGGAEKLPNEDLNDVLLTQYYSGDKIKKNETGGSCSAYGGGDWWGNLRDRDLLGDPGVDGRIILRMIFRKWNVKVWNGSS